MAARKTLEQKRVTARSATKDAAGRPLPAPENVVRLRGVEGEAPQPPESLRGPGRERWARIWAECSWLSPRVDLELVARLCEAHDIYTALQIKSLDAEPLVPGSKGQQRANPLLRELRAVDAQMTALERQAGLTPVARAALSVAEVSAVGVEAGDPISAILGKWAGSHG